MSGTRRRSSLATALCGRMVLPPGPGVAADQALDVDRGPRHEPLERLAPAGVADPVLDAELLLRQSPRPCRRAPSASIAFSAAEIGRAWSAKPSIAGIVAVGGDERGERLHQVPGRAVDARLVARVDVLARPAAPALAAGGQLELDDALGAERDGHVAVRLLRAPRA